MYGQVFLINKLNNSEYESKFGPRQHDNPYCPVKQEPIDQLVEQLTRQSQDQQEEIEQEEDEQDQEDGQQYMTDVQDDHGLDIPDLPSFVQQNHDSNASPLDLLVDVATFKDGFDGRRVTRGQTADNPNLLQYTAADLPADEDDSDVNCSNNDEDNENGEYKPATKRRNNNNNGSRRGGGRGGNTSGSTRGRRPRGGKSINAAMQSRGRDRLSKAVNVHRRPLYPTDFTSFPIVKEQFVGPYDHALARSKFAHTQQFDEKNPYDLIFRPLKQDPVDPNNHVPVVECPALWHIDIYMRNPHKEAKTTTKNDPEHMCYFDHRFYRDHEGIWRYETTKVHDPDRHGAFNTITYIDPVNPNLMHIRSFHPRNKPTDPVYRFYYIFTSVRPVSGKSTLTSTSYFLGVHAVQTSHGTLGVAQEHSWDCERYENMPSHEDLPLCIHPNVYIDEYGKIALSQTYLPSQERQKAKIGSFNQYTRFQLLSEKEKQICIRYFLKNEIINHGKFPHKSLNSSITIYAGYPTICNKRERRNKQFMNTEENVYEHRHPNLFFEGAWAVVSKDLFYFHYQSLFQFLHGFENPADCMKTFRADPLLTVQNDSDRIDERLADPNNQQVKALDAQVAVIRLRLRQLPECAYLSDQQFEDQVWWPLFQNHYPENFLWDGAIAVDGRRVSHLSKKPNAHKSNTMNKQRAPNHRNKRVKVEPEPAHNNNTVKLEPIFEIQRPIDSHVRVSTSEESMAQPVKKKRQPIQRQVAIHVGKNKPYKRKKNDDWSDEESSEEEEETTESDVSMSQSDEDYYD